MMSKSNRFDPLSFSLTSPTIKMKISPFFYLLAFLPLEIFASHNFKSFSAADPLVGAAKSLGKPLIGDDGIVFLCSGKNIYAFAANGTISWTLHLNYTCNLGIDLAYGGKTTVYLVAENRVLKIKNSFNTASQEPLVETFLDLGKENSEDYEIISLSSSLITSSVYVTVRNHGLYSHTLRGRLRWSLNPVVYSLGYRQSCRKNVTDCYFTSGPVIDQCESSLYISNNQGELYSLSVRSPRLKWIQDFSSFDVTFTVTPAKNGRLYVTLPAKSIVFALSVTTGEILWQRGIGPLGSIDYSPVVDSNGWISIGSLDGFVYSLSPTGDVKKYAKGSSVDNVVQTSPFLDCSGYAIYISQVEMEGKKSILYNDLTFISALKPRNVFFTLLVPATGYVYWSETYPGAFTYNLSGTDLKHFALNEAVLLAFIAASNVGNPLPCRTTSQRIAPTCTELRSKARHVYTSSERSILLFLLFETIILVAMGITVRFCCVFWGKRKLQNQGLRGFLEKRRSLRLMKKEYDRSITELVQKAAAKEEEEATNAPEIIEKLTDLVKEREGLQRKLSTTYSLGRDRLSDARRLTSLLPLYDDSNARSHSLQSATKEVTVFHSSSSYEGDSESEGEETEIEVISSSSEAELVISSSSEAEIDNAKGKRIIEEVISSSSESYYADSDSDCSRYGCRFKLYD